MISKSSSYLGCCSNWRRSSIHKGRQWRGRRYQRHTNGRSKTSLSRSCSHGSWSTSPHRWSLGKSTPPRGKAKRGGCSGQACVTTTGSGLVNRKEEPAPWEDGRKRDWNICGQGGLVVQKLYIDNSTRIKLKVWLYSLFPMVSRDMYLEYVPIKESFRGYF